MSVELTKQEFNTLKASVKTVIAFQQLTPECFCSSTVEDLFRLHTALENLK